MPVMWSALSAVFCISLGILSGFVKPAQQSMWYQQLIKPSFNPPGWIFGPVWTVLYALMGIALPVLWQRRTQDVWPWRLFWIQLVLNLAWSPTFFYAEKIQAALVVIVSLWLSIALLLYTLRHQIGLFGLFLPYFLWVSFASFLNWTLWRLNP